MTGCLFPAGKVNGRRDLHYKAPALPTSSGISRHANMADDLIGITHARRETLLFLPSPSVCAQELMTAV